MTSAAAEGARTAMRGKSPEAVNLAVRSAVRETWFRWELVMGINRKAFELLDREGLLIGVLTGADLLAYQASDGHQVEDVDPGRFVAWRDALAFRVSELHAWAAAWSMAEERYLGGHRALFPDVAAAWERLLEQAQSAANSAALLSDLDGAPSVTPADPDATLVRTTELVADLVEPAKSDALEIVGERERAFDVHVAWMRTLFAPAVGLAAGEAAAGEAAVSEAG